MDIYKRCRLLRKKYSNDIDAVVKISILNQIHSAVFLNDDYLPKVITITINVKPILKMHRRFNGYPEEVLRKVLKDLKLEKYHCKQVQCSAFNFSFEINFYNSILE